MNYLLDGPTVMERDGKEKRRMMNELMNSRMMKMDERFELF